MNKQFVLKMMQAKQLQYQALKEVMPEALLNRIAKIENELMDLGKECFMAMMNNPSGDQAANSKSKSKVQKVTIE